MSNSKRSVIFTISFLSSMFIFSFIMPKFEYFFNNYIIFINTIIALIILVFPTIQMICRKIYTSKYLKKEKILFSIKIKQNMSYYRLLNIMLIILILILPLIKGFHIEKITSIIFSTIFWLLLDEIIIQISKVSTKAYFTNDFIVISGYDFRTDIPIADSIKTHSGIYYYGELSNFKIEKDKLILNMNNFTGRLFLNLKADIKDPIINFITAKGIKKIL